MSVLVFVLFLLRFAVVRAGEYCTYHLGGSRHDPSNYAIKWCEHDCCGDWPDQHCCPAVVWIIVGCVIGLLLLVGVIIAVVCCCIKTKGRSGRVTALPPANPQPGANVVVAYSGTSGQYGGPFPPQAYGMPPIGGQPMTYKQSNSYPPPPPPAYSAPMYHPSTAAQFPPPQPMDAAPQSTGMPQ